jgi:hypothetical protein
MKHQNAKRWGNSSVMAGNRMGIRQDSQDYQDRQDFFSNNHVNPAHPVNPVCFSPKTEAAAKSMVFPQAWP